MVHGRWPSEPNRRLGEIHHFQELFGSFSLFCSGVARYANHSNLLCSGHLRPKCLVKTVKVSSFYLLDWPLKTFSPVGALDSNAHF